MSNMNIAQQAGMWTTDNFIVRASKYMMINSDCIARLYVEVTKNAFAYEK